MMLILLVEDETDLAELTIDYLSSFGIDCDYAFDGVNAKHLLAINTYDVIVLDVNMPRLNGFDLCEKLRLSGVLTPIIFLTANDNLSDKLKGFSLGADDYLTKPFELEELAMRIKVLSKRSTRQINQENFNLNTLSIDFQQRKVTRAGRLIELSPTQWQLLTLLARESPNIVGRIAIENELWPDKVPSKDVLKTLVFRLRSLIDNEESVNLIHTIRGVGIALRADT